MVSLRINGLPATAEPGTTILEAARFLGFPIPTLCNRDGLSPYGACRLCVVEIGKAPPCLISQVRRESADGRPPSDAARRAAFVSGETRHELVKSGTESRLVSACTYPVEEGMAVRTGSNRVLRARRVVLELLLGTAPQSKIIQDLAASHGVRRQRFRQEHEDCILCGLCERMCREQMAGRAIGFRGRGERRSIGSPFDARSETCRLCGGCQYVCPVCQLRCSYTEPDRPVCGACANIPAPCAAKENFDDLMCFMDPCVACEIVKEPRAGSAEKLNSKKGDARP